MQVILDKAEVWDAQMAGKRAGGHEASEKRDSVKRYPAENSLESHTNMQKGV